MSMQSFSINFDLLAGVPYPIGPDLAGDILHDAKVELRRRFTMRSVENETDIQEVLINSVLVIPCEQITNQDQILECNSFSLFYIERVSWNIISLRFLCFFNFPGALTPPALIALNLQPDQLVEVDRQQDCWFALSGITNLIINDREAAFAARNARLQPAVPVAPMPMHQPAAHGQLADAVRGAVSASRTVSDKVTTFTGQLVQARGGYTGTVAIADLFYPSAPTILAPEAAVPNALMPVPVEPPQLTMSQRLQPHLCRMDIGVLALRRYLLGQPRFGYTHPMAGIKDSAILALALWRFSDLKTPNSADLATDFCIIPTNVSQLVELFEHITKFYHCELFDAAIANAIREFFQRLVVFAREKPLFASRTGIGALLHMANVKLSSLTDPTTNVNGAGLSLLFAEPPIAELGPRLAEVLTISENDNELVNAMLALILAGQPTPPL